MNWPVKKLNELSDVITKGTTPTSLGFSYKSSGVRFLRAQNINYGKVNFFADDLYIDEDTHKALARSQIVNGDLLVSIAGSIGRSGIVLSNNESLNCNQAVAIVRLKKDVNEKYISHALSSQYVKDQIVNSTVTGVISNLSLSQLGNLKIPLPPLAEQQRIAALLDTAERILTQRELAIAKLDQLSQSVFVEMFGSNEFPFKSLKQLGKVKTGGTPPSSKEGMFGSLIPFITPGDLENKSKPKRFLSLEGAKESVTVKEGSALVCCIGATIGKMSKAKTESAFNQQLNAVEWGDEINPNFGIHALRQIKSKIINGGSATTMPIIKKSLFEKLEIIVPPHELQEKFSLRIKKIETLIDVFDDQLAKSRLLLLSLQHQSFSIN
jgi:type I restriction enzyme S subunit